MGMSFRRVVAVSADKVVMCFSRADGAACKMAAGMASSQASEQRMAALEGAAAPGLLPSMAWGEVRFLDNARPTGRIELERLGTDRFVVCFERLPATAIEGSPPPASGKMVVCSLGLVEEAVGQSGAGDFELRPFEEALELGRGRLVAVSVLEAGRRFAVCHHVDDGINGEAVPAAGTPAAPVAPGRGVLSGVGGRKSTSCRWAEVSVRDDGGQGAGPSFQWTKDVALEVFRQDQGLVAGN